MIVTVRLYNYKSFRHYGGREITTTAVLCKAIVIKSQTDSTTVVELLEDCTGYKAGRTIAIQPKDFNI